MIRWFGPQVNKAVLTEARRRVLKACLLVEATVKTSMKLGGRTESGMLEKGKKPGKINTYRSKPGEIPRVQTGTLRRSITHELHPILPIGYVGTQTEYAKFLEMGTRHMAPRPFLRPGLHASEPGIKLIFEGGV